VDVNSISNQPRLASLSKIFVQKGALVLLKNVQFCVHGFVAESFKGSIVTFLLFYWTHECLGNI